MNKLTAVLAAVVSVAGAQAAVNFTGPGSDVASAANWGDTLPGETDAVNFPAEAIPAGGLTLSAGVKFGATTFAAGYAGTLLFDLNEKSYASSSTLAVNTDMKIFGGSVTNTITTIAAGKTLTFGGTNCLFRTTSGGNGSQYNVKFNAGSVFHMTDGAIYRPAGSGWGICCANNSEFVCDKGAKLDSASIGNTENFATFVASSSNGKICFDDATGDFYTFNVGAKPGGSGNLGLVRNLLLSFKNGAKMSFHANGGRNSRGFRFGRQDSPNTMSISNRFEFVDSTLSQSGQDGGNGGFHFAGYRDTVLVSNSTFAASQVKIYGKENKFEFLDNKSVSGGITFNSTAQSNLFVAAGCKTFPAVSVSGTGNQLFFTNMTTTGTLTLGGSATTCEVAGGKTGAITLSAGAGALLTATDTALGALTIGRDGNRANLSGSGSIASLAIGVNSTLNLLNGFAFSCGGGTYTAIDLNNKTNTVIVLDESTFTCNSFFGNKFGAGDNVGPYTECPGLTFEFHGDSPALVIAADGSQRNAFASGTDSGDNPDGVTFRCVIPQTGYAKAPIRSNVGGSRGARVMGNTRFEILMEGGELPERKMTVPLFSDASGFSQNAGKNDGAWCNASALTTFNKDRIPAGAKFVLSEDHKTLSITIPHRKYGLTLIVR